MVAVWFSRIISLIIGAAIGGLGTLFASDVNQRQALTLELYEEWTTPIMTETKARAGSAEELAVRLHAIDSEINSSNRWLQVEMLPTNLDGSDPARVDELRRAISDLQQERGSLLARLEELDAVDAEKVVATFYARLYGLGAANRIDRQLAAELFGSTSRFWSGANNGLSFELLRQEIEAGRDEAYADVRDRAALGAALVARDFDAGPPNRWIQALGLARSWRDEIRAREIAEKERHHPPPAAAPP